MKLITAAQEYISEGFNPLPLKSNKAPMLSTGHPYLYERVDEQAIPNLFSKAEKIGIACGDVSDGFECIDFDGKNGEPIREIFNQYVKIPQVKHIIDKHKLPIVKSPSGGYHIYYRHTEHRQPPMHLASWETGKVMIETRGNGSYVATVPSTGYKQVSGTSLVELSRLERDERETLLSAAEGFTRQIITKSKTTTTGEWPDKFDTTTVWGKYNENEANEAKQLLTDNGWRFMRVRKHDGVEYWQRPGKDAEDDSFSATWGKCHNMFYCFTDGADGFDQRTAYTPFDIFILYKHGGDKKSAILELEKRYGIKHFKDTTPPPIAPDDPIPADPGTFPIDVFPPVIQRFIGLLNESLNYSVDFLSISIMFVVATLNGNKYKLKVKEGWNTSTVFWFAAVGEPGTMKSHPISTIISPIEDIDRQSKHAYDMEYLDYEQALAEAKNKSLVRKPKFKQIRITDATLESIHEIHSINKRGLGYYKDELVGFINNMNQYRKGADEQFWLESFNNKSYIVNRVSKNPNLIEDTMINIIGTIQPNVLSRITREYEGSGLTDRFLYTSSEENIYPLSDKNIDPGWFEWWNRSVKTMNDVFGFVDNSDTVVLELSKACLDKLVSIDKRVVALQNSDDISESLKNYLSKSKTYLPRITLLVALMDWLFDDAELTITEQQIERADKIMQYFIESSRSIFTKTEKDREISDVASVKKGLTVQETIEFLHQKGFKNAEIARKINKSRAYVGQVVAQFKKK